MTASARVAFIALAAALLVSVLPGSGRGSPGPAATPGATGPSAPTAPGAILELLAPPKGLIPADSVTIYPADRLSGYLETAQSYRDHGVVETATVSFRSPEEEVPQIVVDLHRMSSPDGAVGLYTSEKKLDGERLYIGSGAAWKPGLLIFYDGPYYARIMSQLPMEAAVSCAQNLARLLPTESTLMPIFRLFPIEGRVGKSEENTPTPFLGIPGMQDVWSVQYEDGKGRYTLLLRRNRPPLRKEDMAELGTVTARPTPSSPIQLIELKDGRSLILFFVKMCPYMAGYLGPHPDELRLGIVSRWVESLPKAR